MAGWLGAAYAALMGALALAFLLAPCALIEAFNSDPAVLRVGAGILAVMALDQVLDGVGIGLGVPGALRETPASG